MAQDQFAEYESVRRNPKTGQMIGLKSGQWIPIPPQSTATPSFAPGSIQTKPGGPILNAFEQEHPLRAIPATILQSFGIDPEQVENAHSTIDAMKSAGGQATNEMGEQMFESLAKAGPLAPIHMLGKGIVGVEQGLKEGSIKAYQSYKNGDKFGLTQGLTQVASALGQMALMKEPAEKTTELTGKGVRAVARMPLGINSTAEELAVSDVNKAAADHAAEVKKIDQNYNLEKRAFDRAKSGEAIYRTDKAPADINKETASRVAQGPVKQRLMNFSDRVSQIADKTQSAIKDSFNKRYNAFRKSLGDNPQVNWTPVQEAVVDAEKNILQGSPESLKLFRNIVEEGPQLDEATVFRTSQKTEAAANLKEMMRSRYMDEATKRRIEAQLTAQGVPIEPGKGPATITEGLRIPHKDAWGYAQELNDKMNGMHLPQDVYRSFESVKKAVDGVLQEAADAKNAGPVWKEIQSDYSEYAQRFKDKDSPVYKIIHATNPEERLAIITGKEGQNLIDALHKYRGFGGDTEIAGKVRALQAAASKVVPELTEPKQPVYPKPPAAFDPNDWRKQRLQEYQRRLAERQPPSMWQMAQLPYFRALSRLYSNPAFVKIVLGIK